MKWKMMSERELHAFGIEIILPEIEKEGVIIDEVNPDMKSNPQIIGQQCSSLVFIYVRTACYPKKGSMSEGEYWKCLEWARKHSATPYFASVGIACAAYPDGTPIQNETEMSQPIRHGKFAATYGGLLLMTTSDRVKVYDGKNPNNSLFD